MKICINTLLLVIKVFLNLDEIYSSGVEGASSSSPRVKNKPRASVARDSSGGRPHRILYIRDKAVQVWLDFSRRHVLKAWYEPDCYIPQPEYYRTHDFLIRVLIEEGLKLVAYISKDNRIIGIRAPQQPGGIQYGLEPTLSVFYIIYSGAPFQLTFSMQTMRASNISLMPKNNYKFWDDNEHVAVAGINFTVFRGVYNQITGAELGFQKLHGDSSTINLLSKDVKTERGN